MQNLKKLFFVCIAVGVLGIGCKQANDTQKKEQNVAVFDGSYEGAYNSTLSSLFGSTEIAVLRNGTWNMTINKSGIFKGKFAGIEVKGSVDSSGNLSGIFSFANATTKISGRIKGTEIAGDYDVRSGDNFVWGKFTGVKKIKDKDETNDETSLTFNNQSSKTLENITYGGKAYSQKLAPGHSYKFELDGETNGYIFFKLYNNAPYPSQSSCRTKEVIIIKKGEQKIFNFTDSTLYESL